MDRSEELERERQLDYGDPLACHANIGDAWSAILAQAGWGPGCSDTVPAITPRHVALMLAAMKIVREAYRHKQDNIDDAITYLKFAARFGNAEEP